MIWLRYVPHDEVVAFTSKGWKLHGRLLGNHGNYSVLMIWAGDHEPG